jgi:YidC/Oxa1 family membrane protein insertase
MFDLIGQLVAFFYSVWPSYGMSIVFLTLAVMVIVTPLTLKSTKSMLQMQRLQPDLKRIQTQYKDDRQKMNEELMAFYQENGINPLGGCLPLLVQLPVFLVLFRVVQGLTRRVTGIGEQAGWTAGRFASSAPFDGADVPPRPFDPENLDETGELYQALSHDNEMVSWGIDLSRSAQNVLSDSFVTALPYLVLIAVVLVSSLVQQRQIQGRSTGAQVNPQQQMIMKFLPFMLPVFAFTMPAALVVYFVISNLFRIGQQAYITHSLYSGDESPGALLAQQRAGEKKGAKGGGAKAGAKAGGRTTPKKGEPTAKRDGGGAAKAKTKGSAAKGGAAKGSSAKGGAGRTGKAPSRAHRTGGRTTDPGSPQHRKRKK